MKIQRDETMPKPISIQMYTVRDLNKSPDDYRRLVREIADIGYAGIEGGAPKDMKPAEFKRFVNDLGMQISSGGGSLAKESINQTVETAQALGITHLMGGHGAEKFKSLDEIKKSAEFFLTAAESLAAHGIEVCYHNHWWEFGEVTDDAGNRRFAYDILMELAPAVHAEIDIYWASNFGTNDVPALVKKYAHRTPLLHVKDGPLIKDKPHTAVGDGKLDIPPIIHAADPHTLKWLIVELDHYGPGNDKVMEAVKASYEFLTGAGLAVGRE
jgi:sugar phosphate isomerase/epimerase